MHREYRVGSWAAVMAAVALLLVAGSTLSAQERWTWPERAENLQDLPADFPPERLRAVMTGFTRALGVRCSHCHVGEEGQPLGTYDFPSDDKPQKRTARAMLKMLGDINETLDTIERSGPKPVNMWCHTCHRGQARPMTIEETLAEVYEADGLEPAIARYRELREEFYGRATYDFDESGLNSLGYQLLGTGKHEDAIAVFRLNAEYYPASGNVYDSLAEAYMESGQPELARVYYQKSLELAPDNANAVSKLRELSGG